MPNLVMTRPAAPDYAQYYERYIALVPAGDLVAILRDQAAEVDALLRPLTEEQAGAAYAPGKWTVREVVGHLTDTERVFAFRAAAFSRGDASPLPSFDQEAWTPAGRYNERSLADILDEWGDTRRATIALVRGMPEEALSRRGVASGNGVSALACLTMIPGHVMYHIAHLKEHYLK